VTIPELAAALRRPQAYPFEVDRIEVRQTHISVLFFARGRVYKIKKPVDLGFLDFTTLQRRRFFCEEEVRLNRRLAPDTYLGVASVARDSDGHIRIHSAGAAPSRVPEEVIEYAVEMRRLPADRMLDHLLDHGAVDNAVLDRLVDVLVEFHRSAPTGEGVDEFGAPEAVARAVLDNLRHSRPFAGPLRASASGSVATLSPILHDHLVASTESLLRKHRALFVQRVGDGRIRDGHGDLHAGNICLTDAGIVIYDCIEFTPHLRCGAGAMRRRPKIVSSTRCFPSTRRIWHVCGAKSTRSVPVTMAWSRRRGLTRGERRCSTSIWRLRT
jgi:aminoglycoside phosphotransferase family enzyme